MLKLLAKTAEKYAKATNTACFFLAIFHQPKMPKSMIKKDQLVGIGKNRFEINILTNDIT